MTEKEFKEQLDALKKRVKNKEKDISTTIKLFEDKRVRTAWNEDEEEWYFSIVDVIAILTDSSNPRNYWNMLKSRLNQEGNETYTNCVQLKMQATDGKMRLTDVANTEQLLRIIQSIPSPKAEPFKLWLASIGNDRMNEMMDPEQAIDRALLFYKKQGYSDSWINQRLKSIEIRKDLTDEWNRSGIEGKEYGMLAEASATEISKAQNPKGLKQSREVAKKGGAVARAAREDLEKQTGTSVVTSKNAKNLRGLE